jgi:hypothetical protein
MITRRTLISTAPAGLLAAGMLTRVRAAEMPPAEAAAIAEEAFIYGFPMVMNYGVMYEYFIDKTSSQYKTPFNQLTTRPACTHHRTRRS